MTTVTHQPIKRFEIDYEGIFAWGVDRPIDAAILEMAKVVDGWDWYDIEHITRFAWDAQNEVKQYWGSLYRGPLDVPSSSVEVYKFFVEVTPCLVKVEVYQAEQA